jgi:hypothetical protein
MKSDLIFLGFIFTSIILLSIFVSNTTENFNSPDSVLDGIQDLQNSYKTLQQASTNVSTTLIDTSKGPLTASEVIKTNLQNITTLNTTYNELLNGPKANDVNSIKNIMEKSINEFIDRYNYINKTLKLGLPEKEKNSLNTITTCRKQAISSIPTMKPATETAIEMAKSDPVITAIQTIQDAFIALKQEIIDSGIKLINTPKGEIQVIRMITENIENLNTLAEKYQTMLQGAPPSDPNFIKKYIQKNLNVLINTYNYIIVSLNLNQHQLQKNMILIPDSHETPKIQAAPEIPGQTFNELLSLPMAKLNVALDAQLAKKKNTQLSTQMSTHGFEPPPILINKPPASEFLPPAIPKIIPQPSVKSFSSTYLFDTLSPTKQLATQTSSV